MDLSLSGQRQSPGNHRSWRDDYNHRHPHSTLSALTPAILHTNNGKLDYAPGGKLPKTLLMI
jgi:transposase InsO family protein